MSCPSYREVIASKASWAWPTAAQHTFWRDSACSKLKYLWQWVARWATFWEFRQRSRDHVQELVDVELATTWWGWGSPTSYTCRICRDVQDHSIISMCVVHAAVPAVWCSLKFASYLCHISTSMISCVKPTTHCCFVVSQLSQQRFLFQPSCAS